LAAVEDGAAVSVDLLANDVVPDRAGLVEVLTPSALGTVTIVADLLATPQTAVATFTPGAGAQALKAGEVVTETLTYQVTDVDGNTGTASLTITITGTNDAASITGLAVGSILEDSPMPVSGTLIVQDVDNGEAAFQTPGDLSGTYGTFSFNPATGEWGYTPNASSAALESLVEGQEVTDSLTVTSADGTASQTIVVTITGQNDAPTLAAAVMPAIENGASVTLDLASLGDDADAMEDGTTLTYAVSGQPAIGTASISGTMLTYTIDATYDRLAAGQTETVAITITATDSLGASVTSTVDVTITGTNDDPTLSYVNATDSVTTDSNGDRVISGTVALSDADWIDTHVVTATQLNGLDVQFVINPPVNGVPGSIVWSVVVPMGTPLPPNNSMFVITAQDPAGGVATIEVPFSSNDFADVSDPVQISGNVGEGIGSVSMYDEFTNINGGVLIATADPTETYFGIEFYSDVYSGDPDNELMIYNADNGAFQYLAVGESETFEFDFLLSDGSTNMQAKVEFTVSGTREGLIGDATSETLVGSEWVSEVIRSGAGDDTLTSGGTFDSDVFAFMSVGDGVDLITDFTRGDDHIGVSAAAFGGNLLPGSTTATVLNGTDHTMIDSGGTDGVFILENDGVDSILYWDADGGLGDNAVAITQLTGITELGSQDFFIFV